MTWKERRDEERRKRNLLMSLAKEVAETENKTEKELRDLKFYFGILDRLQPGVISWTATHRRCGGTLEDLVRCPKCGREIGREINDDIVFEGKK